MWAQWGHSPLPAQLQGRTPLGDPSLMLPMVAIRAMLRHAVMLMTVMSLRLILRDTVISPHQDVDEPEAEAGAE